MLIVKIKHIEAMLRFLQQYIHLSIGNRMAANKAVSLRYTVIK